MKVTPTFIQDCYVIEPRVFHDDRGQFFEAYQKSKFEETVGQKVNFVQDNQSVSKKGVLRGLHFQDGVHAQAKLVQVIQGEVLDVLVDLRKDSNTFGQHLKMHLSSENRKFIFIPKGIAHGFLTLSNQATFAYKCDNYYDQASERGIIYKDQTLNIDWEFPENEMVISSKDLKLPTFKALFP